MPEHHTADKKESKSYHDAFASFKQWLERLTFEGWNTRHSQNAHKFEKPIEQLIKSLTHEDLAESHAKTKIHNHIKDLLQEKIRVYEQTHFSDRIDEYFEKYYTQHHDHLKREHERQAQEEAKQKREQEEAKKAQRLENEHSVFKKHASTSPIG